MDKLLKIADVAELLNVPVATVYRWRHERTGPRAYKIGKHLRYRLEDVLDWLDSQRG